MTNLEFADSLLTMDTPYDGKWVFIKDAKVIAYGKNPSEFTDIWRKHLNERVLIKKIPNVEDLQNMNSQLL